ncbi:MAG: hypothetical protein AAGF11_31080 [Myxococcota bacterium]
MDTDSETATDSAPNDNDSDGSDDGDSAADWCDVSEVLARNACLSCHSETPEFNGGGLDLVSDGLAERLVGRPSNNPGCAQSVIIDIDTPQASLLLQTIAPERYAPVEGEQCQFAPMPLLSDATVPPEDVTCIEEWIRGLEEPVPVDPPVPGDAFVVASKVKYLLHGGAITNDELLQVSDDDGKIVNDALETLVAEWMTTPEFRAKRRQFLELTLQQDPSDGNYFYQFRNTKNLSMKPFRDNFRMSMIRTAERIVDDEEDFRSIITTNEWEVTTLLLGALKMADNPMILKSSGIWPKGNYNNDLRSLVNSEGFYDSDLDSKVWRTVTLVHNPDSTHMLSGTKLDDPLYLEYEANAQEHAQYLRSIPDGGSVELRAPRIGFFTTPAFFQTWITNDDNDFRVTINQAMLVATGRSFSPGDITPINTDMSAIDLDVFPVGSECHGCHKNMDRMLTAFSANYDPINSRQHFPEQTVPQPDFSFQGHSVPVDSIQTWAEALASHPNFARAWVVKLCQWGTSAKCDPLDPRVVALATDFEESGFRLNYLFEKFFASRLMTDTSYMEGTEVPGARVSIARQGHFCHAAHTRLKAALAAQGEAEKSAANVCSISDEADILGSSIPDDTFGRGESYLHQPRDMGPFTAVSFEGLCSTSAPFVVASNNKAVFRGDDPEQVLDVMTYQVLGFPEGSEQYTTQRELLQDLYDTQIRGPACADSAVFESTLTSDQPQCGLDLSAIEALQNIWTIACQSPSMIGVGL